MKTHAVKYAILFVLLQVIGIFSASADDKFKKEYNKEFKINANTVFEIKNKFGNIHIENWEQNTVSIKVIISIETSNKEKADNIFEMINIAFSEKDTLIRAITEFKEKFQVRNTHFSIDYEIKMPKTLRIDLTHTYGNVYIDELTGKSNITVKHGALKANKFIFGESKPRSYIYLAYSQGTIEKCDWLKIKLDFSKLRIETAEALIIKSKYSKIAVENCNSIVSESKFDDSFTVDNIQNFISSGEYSTYKIGTVSSKLDIESKFGNIKVDEVASSFSDITLVLKYTDAKINMSENASYSIDAEAENGSIKIPDCEIRKRIVDRSDTKINAIYGKNANPKSKVKISTKFGSVYLL